MSSSLKELNDLSFVKEYVNIKTLNISEKYKIISFQRKKTEFGDRIVVELDNARVFLPQRFDSLITNERLDEFNKKILEGKESIYLVSGGPVGRTTNVQLLDGAK